MKTSAARYRATFFLIFAVSGFSGLIYESIWTHYLKLFLGHSAFAQTLVLVIFMGGMALGAWLASRYSPRWKNLLKAYAVTEGLIGVFALLFHDAFAVSTQFAYDAVFPALGIGHSLFIFKWSLAALLILPQSVLLGMTFPLMSAGIIRRFPKSPGATIATLYFANSLGGAIGVLTSGFFMIEWVGLKGTVMAAGLINIILAHIVWLMAADANAGTYTGRATDDRATDGGGAGTYRFFAAVAFFTGAASFIYEIGWIRMLSLVLGSSTHAFELMLSAFIFGLAFGGLYIRKRIDGIGDAVRFAGIVQVLMGFLALATLPVYSQSFEVMSFIMKSVSKTDAGYGIFNIASHLISLAVMMPAAFCAGITLPLITYILLRKGHGEESIGHVYAANTAGAIIGVLFAVNIGMPYFGLKGLISFGAGLNMALGVALIYISAGSFKKPAPVYVAALCMAAIAVTLFWVKLDPYKMASGVYRDAKARLQDKEILYYRDGKTATISVYKNQRGKITIQTNGKPDATMSLSEDSPRSVDELTQVLLGAIPLLINPDARIAANIGFGSGTTAHILLASPVMERVDTIEIEPFMVEGAEQFRPKVERAFSDPRSRIHIDDAKSFFTAQAIKYDIIVSEPSNPWVSGVSGLFSKEFYGLIRDHLDDDGVFIQWLHLYEINERLVASVIKALASSFSDYTVYSASSLDIIIAAKKEGFAKRPDPKALEKIPGLLEPLKRINIYSVHDVDMLSLGTRKILGPYFDASPVPANSDYFPFLDLNAAKARFMNEKFFDINFLGKSSLPFLEMLEGLKIRHFDADASYSYFQDRLFNSQWAAVMRDYIMHGSDLPEGAPNEIYQLPAITKILFSDCASMNADLWLGRLITLSNRLVPYLTPEELEEIWSNLESQACMSSLPQTHIKWFKLVRATSDRDGKMMARLATELLKYTDPKKDTGIYEYLLSAAMLGYLSGGNTQAARITGEKYSQNLAEGPGSMALKVLLHMASNGKRD